MLPYVETLREAHENHCAVGAFNIFGYTPARCIVKAANALNYPAIIQTSVATAKKFTPAELLRIVNAARADAVKPVYLHLDHCRDEAFARACVDAGWDSVMLDMSHLPFEENAAAVSALVEYAHARNVSVEGELGLIAGAEEDISSDKGSRVSLEDCLSYIRRTNVDAFAPAIGTAHGLYKAAVNLDYDLVAMLSSRTDTPIVVHGGTGLSAEQFGNLVKCGASKINVSTVLKHDYIDNMKTWLLKNPTNYDPLKLDHELEDSLIGVISSHMGFFGARA